MRGHAHMYVQLSDGVYSLQSPCHMSPYRPPYQNNWADVGRQQDVVLELPSITLWLHMRGTFVMKLDEKRERERKGDVSMTASPPSTPTLGCGEGIMWS